MALTNDKIVVAARASAVLTALAVASELTPLPVHLVTMLAGLFLVEAWAWATDRPRCWSVFLVAGAHLVAWVRVGDAFGVVPGLWAGASAAVCMSFVLPVLVTQPGASFFRRMGHTFGRWSVIFVLVWAVGMAFGETVPDEPDHHCGHHQVYDDIEF